MNKQRRNGMGHSGMKGMDCACPIAGAVTSPSMQGSAPIKNAVAYKPKSHDSGTIKGAVTQRGGKG